MKFFINIFRYLNFQVKRLKHLKASPHEIALGFSFGVWTNFNPFFGINLLIAMSLAFICRANVLASVIGTLLTGLPFIFPIFWVFSWYAGSQLISDKLDHTFVLGNETIVENLAEYFSEMLIGSIILFPIVVFICYLPTKFVISFWQYKRKIRKDKTIG